MTSEEQSNLATTWIALQRAKPGSSEHENLFLAFEQLHELCDKNPEVAWSVILLIIATDQSNVIQENLSAGPLEDLLSKHPYTVIERIEREAKSNPQFARLLGGVWQNTMPGDVWQRIHAVWDRRGWDGNQGSPHAKRDVMWKASVEAISVVEQNKETVRQSVQSFNAGDMETMKTLFSPDASIQGVLGKGGLDFAFTIWRELHDSLQVKLTIEEICGEGNIVAVRYLETGTFARPFRAFPGVKPTGKSYTLVAMEWFTFDDQGRITSRYGVRDGGSQFRQVLG